MNLFQFLNLETPQQTPYKKAKFLLAAIIPLIKP